MGTGFCGRSFRSSAWGLFVDGWMQGVALARRRAGREFENRGEVSQS